MFLILFTMETLIPDKSYFRIGEVSKILNVEPYVVRYWETEFRTIKPVRTRTSQRLYRKKDVEELLTIRNLLYSQRFTIDGAKKQLYKAKENRESKNNNGAEKERLMRIKEELIQIKEMFDK
ncbi:MAG: MerR family transcriptional regulator [Syntrophaceae bacterium]|nr:MerR family transcriptional regulator [Syntrophaceae bacterium]